MNVPELTRRCTRCPATLKSSDRSVGQAVHLYAVTDQVIAVDQSVTGDPDGATTAAVTAAARAAQAVHPVGQVTTLAGPTP